jgi:Phage integrase, N-terminal SAM-like domain/Phage integrase family
VETASPKLLNRVRAAIRARHYSPRTEQAYVGWIRRFILFHHKRHPNDMGGHEVEAFLSSLAAVGRVSASTQNQALSALLFVYVEVLGLRIPELQGIVRARKPQRLPVVLMRDEVRRVLAELRGSVCLAALLMYGAGLRLMECVELRVKDVDVDGREIRVRDGKGRKDRVTVLPEVAVAPLRGHLTEVGALHVRDLERGAGWVALPDALARKYPSAGREWGGSGSFRPLGRIWTGSAASAAGIICTKQWFSVCSRTQSGEQASPNARRATRCGTRSPRICSRTATTSGRSRSCWGIGMWAWSDEPVGSVAEAPLYNPPIVCSLLLAWPSLSTGSR